jgi:hypothetical protein
MKINLYVSEENAPLIDRAKRELGDDSLSMIFVQCLKARLPIDTPQGDLETIVMQHGTVKKRFQGRYVFGSQEDAEEFEGVNFTVALSKKGHLVVENLGPANGLNEGSSVTVYDDFVEMADDQKLPSSLKGAVAEELGQEFIDDLDI